MVRLSLVTFTGTCYDDAIKFLVNDKVVILVLVTTAINSGSRNNFAVSTIPTDSLSSVVLTGQASHPPTISNQYESFVSDTKH